MYRTAALLLLCIGTLVLLAIICYKMYKNKKKRERNQDQNGISTYDPSSEGTQQFFAIDRYNYLPISIRCQEYIDIRAGRMPRVIEQSEVDQEQPPTRKSIITVDRCVNTALSFFRGIPN
ncbi:hypothetical protein EMUCRT_0556 [Ehrlichia cf. muris str. EmCRT]|uniref:Uncharacterized protein n=2 Tax=Anaplasmataceae TaxID=942 RepID=A0A0F3NCZ7_9RICK|nr:hypothetical protein EMUCRT_0556 [Ehrlichia cf. muris str. EmCRT]